MPIITPGVYIEEKNAFPNSAVAVETAVPVFIGYTEKAELKNKSLHLIPTRVTSFTEYVKMFGQGFKHKFALNVAGPINNFDSALVQNPAHLFYFYNCIRFFYQNGGSVCYIMSLGTHDGGNHPVTEVNLADFSDEVFSILEKEFEPTLVVLPDIIAAYNADTKGKECYKVYNKVLAHCGKTQNRFGIFDVKHEDDKSDIQHFRDAIGPSFLSYGAAYYPWLNTSIVSPSEIDFNNLVINKYDLIKLILSTDHATNMAAVLKKEDEIIDKETNIEKKKEIKILSDIQLHQFLLAVSPVYSQIMNEISLRLNLMPPAAAMAGIYTLVDSSRGVWKSPANVSISMGNSPSVNISSEQQETMNVDVMAGKSVNAIRAFPGIGVMVWGGRTLDGNSLDWRYINVRRTVIMIEQSLKLACRAYVFEPNDSATWDIVRNIINNFLNNLWKQGALAGADPEQAFDVQVGLGATMTPTDILEGCLRITVKLAIVRPAEFIVITFQQQQQPS